MADYVVLSVALLVGLCGCQGTWVMEHGRGMGYTPRWDMDIETGGIVRPCPTLELNCIRRYFTDNSPCALKHGPVPDPIIFPILNLPLPTSNLTVFMPNLQGSGIRWHISDFYLNKDTDNVVLAVGLQWVSFNDPQGSFKVHQKAKEPAVATDYINSYFDSLTITAIIPNAHSLQLADAEIFAYVDDANAIYSFGPNIINSKDPVVQGAIRLIASNLNGIVREVFKTTSLWLISVYIQQNICDFGFNMPFNYFV